MNVYWNECWKGFSAIQSAQDDNKRCEFCGGICNRAGKRSHKPVKDSNSQVFYGAPVVLHLCRNCYVKQELCM